MWCEVLYSLWPWKDRSFKDVFISALSTVFLYSGWVSFAQFLFGCFYITREREWKNLTFFNSGAVKQEICGKRLTFCIESKCVANLYRTFTFPLVTTVRWKSCKCNIRVTFTSKIIRNKCLSTISTMRESAVLGYSNTDKRWQRTRSLKIECKLLESRESQTT